MATAVIVGSGPAAAGAALVLSSRPDIQITVLDLGVRLEPEKQHVLDRLGVTPGREASALIVEIVRREDVPPVAELR